MRPCEPWLVPWESTACGDHRAEARSGHLMHDVRISATPAQGSNYEIIGDGQGVHWPDVDEDISAEGMLAGDPARRPQQQG